MCLNVHGGLSDKIKIDDFVQRMKEHDVVLLCETWSNKYSDIDLDGYRRMSQLRVKKKGGKRESGGLEIYLKEGLAESVK